MTNFLFKGYQDHKENRTGPKITYGGSPRSVMLDSLPGTDKDDHDARFNNAEDLGDDWIDTNGLEDGGDRTKRAVVEKKTHNLRYII